MCRYRKEVLSNMLNDMKKMDPESLKEELDGIDSDAKDDAKAFIILQRSKLAKSKDKKEVPASIESIDAFIKHGR